MSTEIGVRLRAGPIGTPGIRNWLPNWPERSRGFAIPSSFPAPRGNLSAGKQLDLIFERCSAPGILGALPPLLLCGECRLALPNVDQEENQK
jgi:hypothetical protein